MHRGTGYYQPPYSALDYHKLVNSGMRHEEAVKEAQRLHREQNQIGPDGKIKPNDNRSSRTQAIREETTRRSSGGQPAAPATKPNGVSGPGNDVPVNPQGGYKDQMPATGAPIAGDPFNTGFKPVGMNNPFLPPTTPADPFTKTQSSPPATTERPDTSSSGSPTPPASGRQPVGPIDPASTPAAFRQMANDAAIGRSVTTSGAVGLTPSTAPGGRPTQAEDFRRTISSQYGTGTNVTRAPGQAPGGTTTDLMNRPTGMRQFIQDRTDVQQTKGQVPKDEADNKEEEKPEAEPEETDEEKET